MLSFSYSPSPILLPNVCLVYMGCSCAILATIGFEITPDSANRTQIHNFQQHFFVRHMSQNTGATQCEYIYQFERGDVCYGWWGASMVRRPLGFPN